MNERPLVSLCITCYNQSRFIRESVQSAFDQDYDPLEIVICDDASTDGTNRVIEELVTGYRAKGGRHTVVFRHNTQNLGVLKNYEQAFCLGKGELIVTGSGDDISTPNRVSRIVEAWVKGGCRATVIHHAYVEIDPDGRELSPFPPSDPLYPLGACCAYHRRVFEFFPSPTHVDAYEDMVFAERAWMMGEALAIDEQLAKYRTCGISSNIYFDRQKACRALHMTWESFRQQDEDYAFAEGKLPQAMIERVRGANRRREEACRRWGAFVTARTVRERFWAYVRMDETASPVLILPDWMGGPLNRLSLRVKGPLKSGFRFLFRRELRPHLFLRRLISRIRSTPPGPTHLDSKGRLGSCSLRRRA